MSAVFDFNRRLVAIVKVEPEKRVQGIWNVNIKEVSFGVGLRF